MDVFSGSSSSSSGNVEHWRGSDAGGYEMVDEKGGESGAGLDQDRNFGEHGEEGEEGVDEAALYEKAKVSWYEKCLNRLLGEKRTRRTLRFLKALFNNSEIIMVLRGLMGGLGQIGNIILLLVLLIYIYAVAGMIFFRDNDPWNFRSIEISMLVLMRVATFDTWGENFYTNYYGCDVWPGGMDSVYTNSPDEDSGRLGGIMYCRNPQGFPVLSSVFYISYIFIGSFGILSSIIGIIGESMETSIFKSKLKERELREAEYEEIAEEMVEKVKSSGRVMSRAMMESLQTIKRALQGKVTLQTKQDPFMAQEKPGTYWYCYLELSRRMAVLTRTHMFENTVTLAIILGAVSAGLETSPNVSEDKIQLLEQFIQSIFTIDVLCKAMAEPYPIFYLEDNWNKFDVAIVSISYVPLSGGGSIVLMLRMLRLLRLLKLMKRFRTLQIILETLTSSLKSIVLISGLMFLWMTFLSGIGVALFAKNDPLHYADVRVAFISTFQCMTLDSWSALLYINLFGCDVIGYDERPELCTDPEPKFAAAAIYFPIVVASLTWIMITMFIGLMTTGMEEALQTSNHNERVKRKVRHIKRHRHIAGFSVPRLKTAYDFLDFFNRGVIGPIELYFALEYSGIPLSTEEFGILWDSVDKQNCTHIDFAEFLSITLDVREQTGRRRLSMGDQRQSVRRRSSARIELPSGALQNVGNMGGESEKVKHLSFIDFFFNTSSDSIRGQKSGSGTSTFSTGVAQRSATFSENTNDSESDNKLKLELRHTGHSIGDPEGSNANTQKHAEITDPNIASKVSGYYFSTTANRYSNSPFSM